MRGGTRLLAALLFVAGCEERKVPPPPATPPAARPPMKVPDASAAPALLGAKPATLGPAFDGLVLGQAIDKQAADQFLKQRGIAATALVRDGHLVSLRIALSGAVLPWPSNGDDPYWFDATLHQHASATITEEGTFLQFDLEVPIEQWMNATTRSVVRFDLVSTSLDDIERHIDRPTTSNYVDGHAHVSWTDSALSGAASATEVSVREDQAFRKTRPTGDGGWEVEEIPGARTHELHVSLDASSAIYDAIEKRLTELFGKPTRDRKANTESWKRNKLVLSRTELATGLEHIELVWER